MTYYIDHRSENEDELIAGYRDVEDWKQANPTPPLLVRLKRKG